jgi:hypothetical protein
MYHCSASPNILPRQSVGVNSFKSAPWYDIHFENLEKNDDLGNPFLDSGVVHVPLQRVPEHPGFRVWGFVSRVLGSGFQVFTVTGLSEVPLLL